MKNIRSLALPCLFILILQSCIVSLRAQAVLVSEYYNASDPSAEWNEIIVVQDNLDMRGWFVTDNNTGQTIRQGGVRFKNIDFWKNVRAGTIIGIWHRAYPSNAVADVDTNIADGRVMIARQDAKYFDIVEWTGQPTGFNLARQGDFIQVFNKDTVHIHAVGHRDDVVPGSYWGTMPAPKTNVLLLCEDRSSNRVYPGATLADYNGPNLEVRSQICPGNITRTLPNKDCNTGASNYQFWHTLRSPLWTAPTLTTTVGSGSVLLQWNAMVDANPTDGMQGYVVVRDSGTVPFAPVDGRNYSAGERVGSAVVLANLAAASLTFTDVVDLPCGVIYTYRVYAYRFGRDDEFGDNTLPTTSRGRQYNREVHAFREVLKPSGVGPTLQYTKGSNVFCEGASMTISVPAQPGFTAQWTLNGVDVVNETGLAITARNAGRYRLKLRNAQGCLVLSDSVDVIVNPLPTVDVFPKLSQICKDSIAVLQATMNSDVSYSWSRNGTSIAGATSSQYLATTSGDYTVSVTNTSTGCSAVSTAVTVRPLDVQYTVSTATISFADLEDCVSFNDDNSLSIANTNATDTLRLSAFESTNFTIVSPAFPLVLAPGKSSTVVIRFTPTSNAAVTQSIRFVSDPCSLTKSIALSGRKPGAGSGVTCNVTSKDFGIVPFCGPDPVRVDSISISATSATTITSISVAAPFSVTPADAAGFTLAAGQSRTVPVTFNSNGNPFRVGSGDCVVRFKNGSCSDSLKVNCRGSFTLPQLLVNIPSISFAPLDSCAVLSRDTVVSITNTSAVDVNLDQLADSSLRIVEISGTGTLIVPARSTVKVTLRFSPKGFVTVNNKRILFSAQPCLDVSGFIYSGVRQGVSVSDISSTVDFGNVDVCNGISPRTLNADITVALTNGATMSVSDVRTSSPLLQTSLTQGRQLADGTTTFTVTLASTGGVAPGPFNGRLYMTLEPCGITKEIPVTASFIAPEIRLSSTLKKDTLLDFGTVDVGSQRSISISYRNTSGVPVTLGSLVPIDPRFSYTIVPAPPAVLAPNEEAVLSVTYSPSDTSLLQTSLPITIVQPCADTILVRMIARGKTAGVAPAPFHFEIDHYTSEVGKAITIPVRLVGSDVAGRALRSLGTGINFNTSMLAINDVRIGPALQGFNARISVTKFGIRVEAENGTRVNGEGVAWYLDGVTLLGNALATPLAVDTTSLSFASSELVAGPSVNGSLTITGGCRLPDRLISVGGGVTLRSLVMNADGYGTVDFETVGEQHTVLDVFNMLGENVAHLVNGVLPEGSHHAVFRAQSLSQGRYMLVMRNGEQQRSLPFMIIR